MTVFIDIKDYELYYYYSYDSEEECCSQTAGNNNIVYTDAFLVER